MTPQTQEKWQALLKTQHASGLTVRVFCKQHGLCAKNFGLRQRQLLGNTEKTPTQPFVKVIPKNRTQTHRDTPIVMRGIYGEITFPETISSQWLASLIKALA